MQNRTWTTIGLSPVFLPSRTRVKETCFEYKIQSCYAVNDLHGPAKNGVKPFLKLQRILVKIPIGETRWLWNSFWKLQEAMCGLHGLVKLDEILFEVVSSTKAFCTKNSWRILIRETRWLWKCLLNYSKNIQDFRCHLLHDKILMNKKNDVAAFYHWYS